MKERQEWIKQFMNDFEAKMDARLNRKEETDHHPVHSEINNQEVAFNEDDTPPSTDQEKRVRTLKVLVKSNDGDKVRINVPLNIGKLILKKGSKLSGKWNHALNEQDTDMILAMIDQGHIGEILNVESSDGDTVIIKVE